MKTRERIQRLLNFQSPDRLPIVEWASWWKLTVKRWEQEGLPHGLSVVELQEYFGLDLLVQQWFSPYTGPLPEPVAHGAPIVRDSAEYEAFRQAVQSQLIAAIANYYYSLAMLNDQLAISTETEKLWQANVKTTRALMEAGQSNMAAVSQTEANYYSICTQITDLKQQISDLENEFSALLGDAPQKYDIGTMDGWAVPARLSAGIPAAALCNRPDVKQAETQLAAAYYATNESRAAFYPGINLSGTIGWTNDLGAAVVNPGKWIWNAVGSLTQPLFQNGRLRAQYKISKAQQEQAKLTFQQTLLDAGTEVNAALTKIQASGEKNDLYNKQVAALEKAVKSTQALMMNSSTNYLQVLTAQQTLLTAQMSQISNRFDQIQAVIELYQALGGGYTD